METLINKIHQACIQRGLSYNGNSPIETSPGVFLFYATPLHASCKRNGACRELRYTYVSLGEGGYINP